MYVTQEYWKYMQNNASHKILKISAVSWRSTPDERRGSDGKLNISKYCKLNYRWVTRNTILLKEQFNSRHAKKNRTKIFVKLRSS